MGIFYKFKHKDDNHKNGTSLEDCIVKMFALAGMEPYRDGNKFSAVVLGKHYAFIVTISCMEGNRLLIYVRFPIPVKENVAFAANYEVKRQAAEAIQESFDSYIQIAYDIANEEERDLMRKLRFLAKAKNEDDINKDDFVQGKTEGLVICNDNPWDLLYENGTDKDKDMPEDEKLYEKLSSSVYKDRPYKQRDLGEGKGKVVKKFTLHLQRKTFL
mgnify:CR=1 FL=1